MKWICPHCNETRNLAPNSLGKLYRCRCGRTSTITSSTPEFSADVNLGMEEDSFLNEEPLSPQSLTPLNEVVPVPDTSEHVSTEKQDGRLNEEFSLVDDDDDDDTETAANSDAQQNATKYEEFSLVEDTETAANSDAQQNKTKYEPLSLVDDPESAIDSDPAAGHKKIDEADGSDLFADLNEYQTIGKTSNQPLGFKGYSTNPLIAKQRAQNANKMIDDAFTKTQLDARARANEDIENARNAVLKPIFAGIGIVALLFLLLVGGIAFAMSMKAFQEDTERYIEEVAEQSQQASDSENKFRNGDQAENIASNTSSGGKTSTSGTIKRTVQLELGTATITDRPASISNVLIECNNGLVIEADWKRNPINDYGYDIEEPTVNRTTNRLTVMIMARGVIKNYLNGKY